MTLCQASNYEGIAAKIQSAHVFKVSWWYIMFVYSYMVNPHYAEVFFVNTLEIKVFVF